MIFVSSIFSMINYLKVFTLRYKQTHQFIPGCLDIEQDDKPNTEHKKPLIQKPLSAKVQREQFQC